MAPEFWCQTTPTEFWCHGISGAKLYFADVTPLLELGTTTPCALSCKTKLRIEKRCIVICGASIAANNDSGIAKGVPSSPFLLNKGSYEAIAISSCPSG
ncbi:hypothetical protein Tco_1535793, partial [Tanacetum coccineum]